MSTARSKLLKLRITPEEETWLRGQVGQRGASQFARERIFAEMDGVESRTSPGPQRPTPSGNVATVEKTTPEARREAAEPADPLDDKLALFEQKVKAKRAKGKTRRLAEIEAREELNL